MNHLRGDPTLYRQNNIGPYSTVYPKLPTETTNKSLLQKTTKEVCP